MRPTREPTERYGTVRWALIGNPALSRLVRSDGLRASLKKRGSIRLSVAWTDAEAEPRPTNANARLAIVVRGRRSIAEAHNNCPR